VVAGLVDEGFDGILRQQAVAAQFFSRYDRAGAQHSIVSILDVSSSDSIEAFEPVITDF
jgi:hypothetical protein